jgi:hypothetical protein
MVSLCIHVPDEVLYSSTVPPVLVLHPLSAPMAHTIDKIRRVFIPKPRSDCGSRQRRYIPRSNRADTRLWVITVRLFNPKSDGALGERISQGGGIAGPALGSCGNEGSTPFGPINPVGEDCIESEEPLYVSPEPPWFVLQPLKMAAAKTIDKINKAVFIDAFSGDFECWQWSVNPIFG